MTEIPRWQSHKVVTGDKVIAIERIFDATHKDGPQHVEQWTLTVGAVITAGGSLRSRVTAADAIGGYYIRYDSGYESWTAAEEFEAGYTRIAM